MIQPSRRSDILKLIRCAWHNILVIIDVDEGVPDPTKSLTFFHCFLGNYPKVDFKCTAPSAPTEPACWLDLSGAASYQTLFMFTFYIFPLYSLHSDMPSFSFFITYDPQAETSWFLRLDINNSRKENNLCRSTLTIFFILADAAHQKVPTILETLPYLI
uniref:MULE domain-containing protein n=1 Tax=Strongyloides venezuelensis TaxID=75913 RepID=A0A0K0F5Z1_STRVS